MMYAIIITLSIHSVIKTAQLQRLKSLIRRIKQADSELYNKAVNYNKAA